MGLTWLNPVAFKAPEGPVTFIPVNGMLHPSDVLTIMEWVPVGTEKTLVFTKEPPFKLYEYIPEPPEAFTVIVPPVPKHTLSIFKVAVGTPKTVTFPIPK